MTRPVLNILLSCVYNLIYGNDAFYLVAYQWRHIPFAPIGCYNFQGKTSEEGSWQT